LRNEKSVKIKIQTPVYHIYRNLEEKLGIREFILKKPLKYSIFKMLKKFLDFLIGAFSPEKEHILKDF